MVQPRQVEGFAGLRETSPIASASIDSFVAIQPVNPEKLSVSCRAARVRCVGVGGTPREHVPGKSNLRKGDKSLPATGRETEIRQK